MKNDANVKLQAYVDGELPSPDRKVIEELLASDPKTQLLHRELRAVKALLVEGELTLKLPESREFYWSKIAGQIEHQEQQPSRPRPSAWFQKWVRWWVPLGATALVLIVAGISTGYLPFSSTTAQARLMQEIESPLAEASVFDFHDQKAGMTVVWVHGLD